MTYLKKRNSSYHFQKLHINVHLSDTNIKSFFFNYVVLCVLLVFCSVALCLFTFSINFTAIHILIFYSSELCWFLWIQWIWWISLWMEKTKWRPPIVRPRLLLQLWMLSSPTCCQPSAIQMWCQWRICYHFSHTDCILPVYAVYIRSVSYKSNYASWNEILLYQTYVC